MLGLLKSRSRQPILRRFFLTAKIASPSRMLQPTCTEFYIHPTFDLHRKDCVPICANNAPSLPHHRTSKRDYEAWLEHLRTREVAETRRGHSVAQEYEQWVAQRTSFQATA